MIKAELKTIVAYLAPLVITLACFAAQAEAQRPSDPALLKKYEIAAKLTVEAVQLRQKRNEEATVEAISKYRSAAEIYRSIGSRIEEAYSEYYIADVYYDPPYQPENFRKAREHMERAVEILRKTDERKGLAFILNTLGNAYSDLSEQQKALAYYQEALTIYTESRDEVNQASTLGNIGTVYYDLDDREKALDSFNKALTINREIKNQRGEAFVLRNIGTIYFDLGQNQKALECFEQSREIYGALGDKLGEARALREIGGVHFFFDEYQKALDNYNKALSVFKESGAKNDEAPVLSRLGSVYDYLEDPKRAMECFEQALSIYRSIENLSGEAVTLKKIGSIYDGLKENQKAIEFYESALTLFRKTNDRLNEANTIQSLASIYNLRGNTRKALDLYNNALNIYRAINDPSGEASVYSSMGSIYLDLNEIQRSLEHHEKALTYYKNSENRPAQALTTRDIADVHYRLGKYQKALELYDRSLKYFRSVGNRRQEASTLNMIAIVHGALGNRQLEIELYLQILPIQREINDRNGEATTLSNIGLSFNENGESKKALEYYKLALPLSQAVEDKTLEATIIHNIGGAYSDLHENQKALEYLNKSIEIKKQIGDIRNEAASKRLIGLVYLDLGDTQAATRNLTEALATISAVKEPRREAQILDNLMTVWRKRKDPFLAILYGKRSVNVYQELRGNIKGLDAGAQKTFLRSIEPTYRAVAELLISQGRIAEAEQVLGMLKEEEYFSFVRRDDSAAKYLKNQKIALSPDEHKAFEEYEKLAGEITNTAAAYEELRKKKLALPLGESLPAAEQAEHDRLKAAADAAVTVFSKFLDDLKVRFGGSDKRVAALESDSIGLLKEVNQPRTVMISTIVGEDRLNLIVTTASVQKAHTVEIKSEELNKLILEFRNALTNPRIDPRPAGRALYDKLFPAELKKDLANVNTDTIVWSLDGALRYAPMAALWDGEKYLAERYQNAVLTLASRSKLSSAGTDSANWKAFGVGVSKEVPGEFSALPAVPRELCSVIADAKKKALCDTFGRKGVFYGLMLADEEFTLDSFENSLGKTPVVHIASHFALNPGNETESFLLLGGGADRKFSLDRLRKTRLDGVELLPLSACNTAMTSGNKSNGVEVEGFGAMALNNGAKSVLATLWPVADEGTQLLMSEFYRLKKETPSMSKSAALQAAQRAMIDGKVKSSGTDSGCRAKKFGAGDAAAFKCDPNAPFTHPYFWAPFVLIGNWR